MIKRGEHEKARQQLRKVHDVKDIDEEFNDLIAASEESKKVEHPWRNLLQLKYRSHLTMAIMIPFLQQFTGIIVIMFYAPLLFGFIGFKDNSALVSAVITDVVNVAATVVSIYGVDKWGRRALFLEGGNRGALNIEFQLSITVGILVANVLNYFFANIKGGWGWRLSLGGNIDEEFNDLIAASEESKKIEHPWRNLLQRKYMPHVTMAIMIPFLQQFTGIIVIMFYAPVLFGSICFKDNSVLMSAVITGVVNVAATVVSIYGVDKWGRRALFLEGRN
ncbi:hypothetical protein HN51_045271 [Arachis hypogaea]